MILYVIISSSAPSAVNENTVKSTNHRELNCNDETADISLLACINYRTAIFMNLPVAASCSCAFGDVSSYLGGKNKVTLRELTERKLQVWGVTSGRVILESVRPGKITF